VLYFYLVGSSVSNAQVVLDKPNSQSDIHSVTVTCTIDPDSPAELCEVIAVPTSGGTTLIGIDCVHNLVWHTVCAGLC